MADTPFAFSIAVNDPRELVYDSTRDLLYVTTGDGDLERYDLASRSLLAPWNVGNELRGADITADHATLYVAEVQREGDQGFVLKVDLATGQVDQIPYQRAFGEGGSFDIAIRADGKAFVTTVYEGSGNTPLRLLNLATETYVLSKPVPLTGEREVDGGTRIERSLDGQFLVFSEIPGGIWTFDLSEHAFGASRQYIGRVEKVEAVNRDGSLIAVVVVTLDGPILKVWDSELNGLRGFPDAHAAAFDPVLDVLYILHGSTNELLAYDIQGFSLLYRLDVGGEVIFDLATRQIALTDDGEYAFVSVVDGLRGLKLPDFGTRNNDDFIGAADPDFYLGLAGSDLIDMREGDDRAEGGSGRDTLSGGEGSDSLMGGPDADVIDAGAGSDDVAGGKGDDSVFGGADDDVLTGYDGNDTLLGQSGSDLLSAHAGSDALFGGRGHDALLGGAGDDVLAGGAGDDILQGQEGRDLLTSGTGHDTVDGGGGRDSLFGGAGDVLRGADGADVLTVDAFSFASVDGGAGSDMLVLNGRGFDIDLQLLDDTRIAKIEVIDLNGTGANTLTIAASDVLVMSSTTDLLVVEGGDDDVLRLVGDWDRTEVVGYDLYSSDGATVLANAAMQVDLTG